MNQHTQAGNSNAPHYFPMKRKRGRPRKDPSLKRVAVARAPPGYGIRENKSHQAETIDFSNGGGMVGQPVTGVIEAAFDAGYLLSVRIGNSHTNFRGVVFKPGNFVPVTALNDVAPHAQMIKRNDVPFPLEKHAQSSNFPRERFEMNGVSQGQRFTSQSSALVPSKGRHALPPSSFTHLNGRGAVVPVVLQHTTAFNGSSPSDSSDRDVVAAEPLSVLLPFGSQSSNQFLTAKTDQLPSRVHNNEQLPPRSLQNANDSCSDGSHANEERSEAENLRQVEVPVTVTQGSLQPSYKHDMGGSSAPFSQMDMDQGISNIPYPHGTQHL